MNKYAIKLRYGYYEQVCYKVNKCINSYVKNILYVHNYCIIVHVTLIINLLVCVSKGFKESSHIYIEGGGD